MTTKAAKTYRFWLVTLAAFGLVAVALPTLADAQSPPAQVVSLNVTPVELPPGGGTVEVSGVVRHAITCQLELLSQQSFPVVYASNVRPCSSSFQARVTIGRNHSPVSRTVAFSLIARGYTSIFTAGFSVSLASGPPKTTTTTSTTTTTTTPPVVTVTVVITDGWVAWPLGSKVVDGGQCLGRTVQGLAVALMDENQTRLGLRQISGLGGINLEAGGCAYKLPFPNASTREASYGVQIGGPFNGHNLVWFSNAEAAEDNYDLGVTFS